MADWPDNGVDIPDNAASTRANANWDFFAASQTRNIAA